MAMTKENILELIQGMQHPVMSVATSDVGAPPQPSPKGGGQITHLYRHSSVNSY